MKSVEKIEFYVFYFKAKFPKILSNWKFMMLKLKSFWFLVRLQINRFFIHIEAHEALYI